MAGPSDDEITETSAAMHTARSPLPAAGFCSTLPCIERLRARLGLVAKVQGDWAAATQLLRSSVSSLSHLLGDDHPEVAVLRVELGEVLISEGSTCGGSKAIQEELQEEAEAVLTHAWRVLQQQHGGEGEEGK
jgi:hypothetical protein